MGVVETIQRVGDGVDDPRREIDLLIRAVVNRQVRRTRHPADAMLDVLARRVEPRVLALAREEVALLARDVARIRTRSAGGGGCVACRMTGEHVSDAMAAYTARLRTGLA